MSSGLTCHNCGSSEFETDQARGDTVCMKCGIVIEDNVIVNEIQFEEGSFGGTHVVGQRVTDDYGGSRITVGGLIGSGKQSRQITLDNAKKKIKTVANLLNLNSVCIDQAFGFYKMALNRRLTHGRKNSHVIAACVYMVCRLELTPHILLDLSDIMSVNVYSLGQTYLRLTSALSIKIPPIDPCIYIMRYAYKLSGSINCFKEKSNEIQMTALRLVSRMKRDWMHAGRRPSGLCGAALLVSARLHGLHCSIKDVIKVVKVCETTIRKRLNEFGDTPSSKLTLEEFLSIDLEGEEDPPCYKTARRKHKEECTQEKQENELELKEELSKEIGELQVKIDKALEKSRKKLKGPYARYAQVANEAVADGADLRTDEERLTMEIIESTTVETIKTVLTDGDQQQMKGDNNLFDSIEELRPTAESLGLTAKNDQSDPNEQAERPANEADNGTLYYDDISDSEIDSYLLSPSEIQSKTNYWVKYHADYLKEMEEKELKKQQDEELRKEREAKGEVTPKKKRKTRKRSQTAEAGSAGEAVERMLMDKFPKLSSKINYDILKKLERTDPAEELEAMEAQRTKEASELTRLDTYENRSYLRSNTSLKRLPRLNTSTFGSDNSHVNKFKPSQAQSLKSKFSSLISSRQNATSTASGKTPVENGTQSVNSNLATRKEQLAATHLDEDSEELESEDEYSHSKEQTLSLAGLMSAAVDDDYEMDYDELDY